MHEAGQSKLVLWDKPEVGGWWGGKWEGGSGWRHTYVPMDDSCQLSSAQFNSVVSDFLWPHGLQHARPPCPSPGVYPNPCPLSQWSHPTISSSVIPFSSCLQSFPASWSFQMSQLFTSGDQSIEASALTSVLPMNTQGLFPLVFAIKWWDQMPWS